MNAPTLTGTAGDQRNDLSWSAVTGAVKYRLYRAIGSGSYGSLYTGTARQYAHDSLTNGKVYHYRVRGVDNKGRNGPWSNVVNLQPQAVVVVPPPTGQPVGYAAVAGTTGGEGGQVYNVSTFAALRTALEASGARIINITGSSVLDGAGAEFSVTNDNVTIDGSAWTGVMKNYKITFRCSNVIIREVAWRTGEGSNAAASADRRAITFNPPTGQSINRILLDHCSFAWGPDVVMSMLNECFDVTVQYCILGPALDESNIASSPNGYGPRIASTTNDNLHAQRHTWYRNYIAMNKRRNFAAQGILGWDAVNNVLYDWGDKSGHGNPRGANVMNNFFKQGPETGNNNDGWTSDLSGPGTSYHPNSIYFAGNAGRKADGSALTLAENYATGVKRTAVYDGGPTAATHGALTVDPANDALFAAVVAGAGRTHQDAIDTLIKAHAMAGTSDGFYNGAGHPAPHPSWP